MSKVAVRKNSAGFVVGVFVAAMHLGWLILVGTGVAKVVMDWCLKVHHVSFSYTIEKLDPVNAAFLLVMTFVGGYVFGWVLAGLWNLIGKK